VTRRVDLDVGTDVTIDGVVLQVFAVKGDVVLLCDGNGESMRASLAGLAVSDAVNISPGTGRELSAPSVPNVASHLLERAEELMAHVQEVETGFRSGDPARRLPDEPRPDYDPDRSVKERVRAKAAELRCSERTVERLRAAVRDRGVAGLIDGRKTRPRSEPVFEPRVLAAVNEVLCETRDKSTLSNQEIRRRTQRLLDKTHGKGVAQVPPESSFNKKLAALDKERAARGPAKRRRSIARRPSTPYNSMAATRPGEYVLIDSTRLDVLLVDPASGQWMSVELSVALDLYSRSVLAFRVTPPSAKAVDAVLLVHDLLRPTWARRDWGPEARWPYTGIPENLILAAERPPADDQVLACVPPLRPETIVCDNAKIYTSQLFEDACRTLEISILRARPYRPTDKGQIEQFFKTLRLKLLVSLPGYKGPDVSHRGEAVEDDAVICVDEFEELLAEWIVRYWQNRPHAGLHLPSRPELEVTPNQMVEEGVTRCGCIHIPSDPAFALALLPKSYRTIQRYGVELLGFRYDGAGLEPYRHVLSGEREGKWPIYHDPRDLSEIFFPDPETGEWHYLRRKGRLGQVPFNDLTAEYAKRLWRERASGGSLVSPDDVLDDVLEGVYANAESDARERRRAKNRRLHAAQAAKDRGMLGRPEEVDQLVEDTPSGLFPVDDLIIEAAPPAIGDGWWADDADEEAGE